MDRYSRGFGRGHVSGVKLGWLVVGIWGEWVSGALKVWLKNRVKSGMRF